MVLVYLPTNLGDFVRVNVGIHIPAPWFAFGIQIPSDTIWLFNIAMENPQNKWRFSSLGKSSISMGHGFHGYVKTPGLIISDDVEHLTYLFAEVELITTENANPQWKALAPGSVR